MKTSENGCRQMLIAVVLSGLASLSVKAQLYTNSFDTSTSISVARFDYGSATPTANHSVLWSSLDAAGSPSSGSLQLSLALSTTADGTSSGAFTLDLFYPGRTFASLSFDLYVNPNSATDAYHGGGFFEAVTRLTDSYNFVSVYSQELGNPNYNSTPQYYGSWQHIVVPLTAANGTAIRALTFQDYDDPARGLNGTVTLNIDNIELIPEPSLAALFGLGVAAFCWPRRKLEASRH